MNTKFRPNQLLTRWGALATTIAVFYYSSSVAAQLTEKDFTNDLPVVLSVSRLEQPLIESTSAVTIIDRKVIAASGAREIKDLLRFVPGFQVADYNGATPVVSYHGLTTQYSQHLQVLINGRSVYLPLFGGVFWSDLPIDVDDIEKIEVIRGPNAALYGSNSFSAIINITTKQATGSSQSEIKVRAGGNNISDAYIHYNELKDDFEYSLSASFLQDDGFQHFTDHKRKLRLSGFLNYQLSNDHALTVETGLLNGRRGAGRDDGLGDLPRELDIKDRHARIKLNGTFSATQEWYLQYFYHTHQLDDAFQFDTQLPGGLLTPLILPPFALVPVRARLDYSGDSKRQDLELQYTHHLNNELRYVAGLSLRHDRLDSPLLGTASTHTLNQQRLFANLEYRLHPDWIINLGGMLEDNEVVDPIFSPKAALVYKINEQQSLRFTRSLASRLPVMLEEFSDASATATTIDRSPNSAYTTQLILSSGGLDAEEITSTEIGYSLQQQNLKFSAKLFREELSRLISQTDINVPITVALSGKISDFDNTDDATIKGAEMQIEYPITDTFWMKSGYSYINIESDDRNAAFSESAPEHSAYFIGSYTLDSHSTFSVSYNYYDTYRNIDSSFLDDIKRLDVKYDYNFQAFHYKNTVSIVLQNIVDNYQNYNRGNQAETVAYISLSSKF